MVKYLSTVYKVYVWTEQHQDTVLWAYDHRFTVKPNNKHKPQMG